MKPVLLIDPHRAAHDVLVGGSRAVQVYKVITWVSRVRLTGRESIHLGFVMGHGI